MKKREAFDLRSTMVLYNVGMVFWNAYLVYEFLAAGWGGDLSFGCEPVDPSPTGKPMRMVRAGYLFYITKLVEMIDTLFFLLRKRFLFITFLHVFHHAAMPASVWFGIKFAPGGSGSLYALVNSVIHVIMYAYYGINAAGPEYKKYLWWKPFMTLAQITQFVIFIVFYQQFIYTQCDYPFVFCMAIFVYAWIFLCLFLQFFIHDNCSRKKRIGKVEDSNGHSSLKSTSTNGKKSYRNGNVNSTSSSTTTYSNSQQKTKSINGSTEESVRKRK
jgi:hypothetical protein